MKRRDFVRAGIAGAASVAVPGAAAAAEEIRGRQAQPFKLDYVWAGLCLMGAVYFIFRS